MNLNKSMRWALCALVGLVLASCGGGGANVASSGGVGHGGTGISMGTVTGFGSVVVDGTAYSSATPLYFAGTDTDEAAPASSAAVELGDQLQITLDANGNPSTVVIEPELKGPVSNLLSAASPGFTVNGVAVRVNSDPAAGPVTYYAGAAGYGGLAAAMQVEVHGVYGVDSAGRGYIQATLIEQLPSTNPVTRITGQVANLLANPDGSGSFNIGGVTVRYAASASVLPAGVNLANGQLVNAWSKAAGAPGVIDASVVRIRTLQGMSSPVQVSGLVAGLTGSGFQLSGIPVDASAAGPAAVLPTLAPGQYVVVQGQATAATGVVVASKIQVYAVQAAPVALHGTITGFVSTSNFLVRGVSVDASGPAVAFSPAGAAATALANGVFVDVTGMVSGNKVTASTVTVQSAPPAGRTVDYQGVVSQCPTAGCTSFVLTLRDGTVRAVTLAANVAYSNGSMAQLVDSASVEVEATTSTTAATDLVAYSVSFQGLGPPLPGGDGATLETNGVAYDVNLTATPPTFAVHGLTIQINGVTPKGGTLANGVKVEVDFVQAGGTNLAKAIGIDR